MSPTRLRWTAVFAGAFLALAPALRADGIFDPWQAYAYLQAIALDRPQGLPPAGDLDDNSHQSTGLNHEGLFVQKLEAKLWGPLGPQGWSATLGTQTDLVSTGITDAYAEWVSPTKRWSLKAGQERLPFGAEEQRSSARLLGIQRGLPYGFANYGHVNSWGLGVLAERGDGLRLDFSQKAAPGLGITLQSGAFSAGGNSFNPGPCASARAAIEVGALPWALELGASAEAGRDNLEVASTRYLPLGALPGGALDQGAGDGAKATVKTWGQDARLDLGPLHLGAEAAFQSLDALTRDGGKLSVACDLPLGLGRPFYVYGCEEQAASNFGDGVHRPGSLYRARTLGLFSPLPLNSGLKLESLQVSGDDFPSSFLDGQIFQAQWQIEL
jgi:hypothetical protein